MKTHCTEAAPAAVRQRYVCATLVEGSYTAQDA